MMTVQEERYAQVRCEKEPEGMTFRIEDRGCHVGRPAGQIGDVGGEDA